jgi:hypothetical protein
MIGAACAAVYGFCGPLQRPIIAYLFHPISSFEIELN